MIPRDKMPQIPSDRFDDFEEFLRESGVDVRYQRLPIIKLKPIQQHVNRDKVEHMKENQKALSIPLIVSQKMYILDGHHRWVTRRELDETGDVTCLWCNCSIKKLIELGHDFEYSFTKSVHETTIPLRSAIL